MDSNSHKVFKPGVRLCLFASNQLKNTIPQEVLIEVI